MGVINRTQNASEQRKSFNISQNVALTAGETGVLVHVPFPCHVSGMQLGAFNVQADVNLMMTVQRFIPGAGITMFAISSTFVPADFGTSGVLVSGVSLLASGSSLMLLISNDVIGYQVGGGSTAMITNLSGCVVLRPLQDNKVFLGLI